MTQMEISTFLFLKMAAHSFVKNPVFFKMVSLLFYLCVDWA